MERTAVQLVEKDKGRWQRREAAYRLARDKTRSHILNVMRDSEVALLSRLANLGAIR